LLLGQITQAEIVLQHRGEQATMCRWVTNKRRAQRCDGFSHHPNHRQFFIPRGFAHGFSVLSDEVIFQYKCDNFYAPQSEGAIAWNDPALKIDWRIPTEKVILSEKDKHHPLLADAEWLFDYHEDLYKE
jgi:dTDP-4-dehydrorhamnose 3,5-epimerase